MGKKSPDIPWYVGKGLHLLTHRKRSKYQKKDWNFKIILPFLISSQHINIFVRYFLCA